MIEVVCTACRGKGTVDGVICPRCGGFGKRREPARGKSFSTTLSDRIAWLHNSSERMRRAISLGDKTQLSFLRRESWIHLKRSAELWWHLHWRQGR